MKIRLTSVFVEDQDKALTFYTDVLGFVLKHNIPCGDDKWLTVTAPDEPSGAELLLEPNSSPVATEYQKGLKAQGIPCAQFAVENVEEEFQRLKDKGVMFSMPPTEVGPTIIAVFDDTCGNFIQLVQM